MSDVPRCTCCSRRLRRVLPADPRCSRCRNGSCAACRTPGHRGPARLRAEREAAIDPRLAAFRTLAERKLPLFPERRRDR
jgi:hypothetical protein